MNILDFILHPIQGWRNHQAIRASEGRSREDHLKCIKNLEAIERCYDVHYSAGKARCTIRRFIT